VSLKLARLEARVFRAPISTPVVASFGIMRDRPMALVLAEDVDGAVGWGEIWCNFPTVGAEHRARLVHTVLAPLALARSFAAPDEAFCFLSERTAVLALQSGEPGPLAQAVAGVDIALWDMVARRAGKPLWRMLGGTSARVPVYASGLNPEGPERLAAERLAEGYRAFKLKVGFGEERDLANLKALKDVVGDSALMVDANQGWDAATAAAMARRMAPFGLQWLEEPLRADRPWEEWRGVARAGEIALAAGENLAGASAFDEALAANVLGVVQPDMAKWGGFSGCLPVARAILAAKHRYCPHYLGGGIGLLASAHLLAAAGGDGMLEVDANPNPLRTLACGPLARLSDGVADLGEAPGLGMEFDPAILRGFEVAL
jgi:D-galactarolactone cycloisomerase